MTYATNMRPLGYQQITDLSASTALTVPEGCALVLITPSVASIRWRDDGVAPTAGVGYPLLAGSELVYAASFAAFRMIQQSAGAVVDIVYYAA